MTALEALNLAAPLADTYNAVERKLLVAIARQLTLNDNHELNEVSKWQIKKLTQLGQLDRDAAKIIAAGTKGVPADFAGTVQKAIETTLAEDGLTDMWHNQSFSESAKKAVRHYRAQAKDVYNQVNTVMKYKAHSSYVKAVNSVADKMTAESRIRQAEIADKQSFLDIMNSNAAAAASGSVTRTRAVRDTIHEMAQRGIPAFVDRAGREWSPEAYVNMDVRNTVKNTATEAAFGTMDALGQDVFEVSAHAGARHKCRPWQGKLISKSGRTAEITDLRGRKYKVFPLSATSYGEPDGLFGINCGHRPRGVSDGLFVKSSKTSEEYGKDDEELYNRICRQRELERRVRKTKTEADMLEAAGDTEGAKAVRRRAAEQNKQLRAYCEENGLKYRGGRVKTYGKVTAGLTNGKNGGIIEMTRKKDGAHRRTSSRGLQIIDKPTYNKLTEDFIKHDGIIIRGADAERHLKNNYASYLPSLNTAFIRDDATISEVLEEMYHAKQDRTKMFGEVLTTEVHLRREIDAQKYLLSVTDKFKIPDEEVAVTKANLEYYENELKKLLGGERHET